MVELHILYLAEGGVQQHRLPLLHEVKPWGPVLVLGGGARLGCQPSYFYPKYTIFAALFDELVTLCTISGALIFYLTPTPIFDLIAWVTLKFCTWPWLVTSATLSAPVSRCTDAGRSTRVAKISTTHKANTVYVQNNKITIIIKRNKVLYL